MHPASPVPTIGASGAISGVLGAYLWLFPRARVWMFIPILLVWGFRIPLPAWTFIIYWALAQFISARVSLLPHQEGAGVAYWAHLGGFIAGLILVHFFLDVRRTRQARRG
jgi:membrane associated rhomboid family serine protease